MTQQAQIVPPHPIKMWHEVWVYEYGDAQSLGTFPTRQEALAALGQWFLDHGDALLVHPRIVEQRPPCQGRHQGKRCTESAVYELWAVAAPSVRMCYCTAHTIKTYHRAAEDGIRLAAEQLP